METNFKHLILCIVFGFTFASCSCNKPTPDQANKVAVIFKDGSSFFKIMQLGIEDTANKHGLTVECYYATGEVDYEGQLAILRSLDLSQYKGIIITPTVPTKMIEELNRIGKLLPLVVVDTPVDASISYRAFIGTDNFNAGKVFGTEAKKILGKDNEPMTRFIVQLSNNTVIKQRIEGFLTEASSVGTFNVIEVGNNIEEGIAKIKEEVKKVPVGTSIGIFAANGSSCDLVIEATKDLTQKLFIVNFDMTQAVAEQLYAGTILCTQAQDTYGMGATAIEKIQTSDTPKERDIYLPTMLIRSSNMFSPEVSNYMKGINLPE